ncbi:MAG: MBL fold metallo-hydrolase, partial [Pseudomonadota bacterium]
SSASSISPQSTAGCVLSTRPNVADDPPAPTNRPMPSVDARFPAEIAPGVFSLPDRRIPLVPNIGIVVGTERVLVVDCGLGMDSAEAVLATAMRLAPGREIVLTITHAHPEHGLSAQVFKNDARIFYNGAQRDHLLRSGQALLDGFRGFVLPDEHKHLLDGIVITEPDETYDGATAAIDLGSREVVLRSFGTAHSPGDQIIHVPDAGVVFAGDLVEERIYPIVPFFPPMIGAEDINLPRWTDVLGEIASLEPRILVPGHGSLGGVKIAEDVAGYLRALEEVSMLDLSADAIEAELRRRYPTWEHPHFIAPAIRYVTR